MIPKSNSINGSNGSHSSGTVLPWVICSIGMLFYCYNYFLRVSPSVMQSDLMQGFHITASEFGSLLSFYYLAYTPMQIPVGMLYDRFGARLVLFFACLVATSGVAGFIAADNYGMASLGRFFIGLGTAFAYIGVLKLASLWLPPNRFAAVAGLTTAFGMASAIFCDTYLPGLIHAVGYQNALHTALMVGIALSAIIFLFMRDKVPDANCPHHHPKKLMQLLQALQITLMKPQMWLIGLIGCLFYLPASVFLDAWGIPYLQTVYQLPAAEASHIVIMTFLGWMIAGPSIGAFSDRIGRRRSPLLFCAVMAAVLFCVIFYIPGIPLTVLYVIFFLIGIFCGAHPLCFALGKENNPASISGTAVAVTNTLIMVGGVIFHPVVGKLLDTHASHVILQNGIPLYSASDYNYALSVVPIGLMITVVLTFFLKETYCAPQAEPEETEKTTASPVFSAP